MKRLNEYKKLFAVEGKLDLKELKAKYRSLVKEWHPDKFQAGDDKALEAEEMSTKIIDAYHNLHEKGYNDLNDLLLEFSCFGIKNEFIIWIVRKNYL